jgi:hypothetical protein
MDFTFIEELRRLLEHNNIFGWSFLLSGCKAMALALLMFKLLNTYISDFDTETPKMGNIFNVIGYACIIMSCDWIIGFIEGLFSQIDGMVATTPSDLFGRMETILQQQMDVYNSDDIGFFDMTIDIIFSFLFYVCYAIVAFCFKIADLSLTCAFLLTRVFLIQLMKLFFPLVIALSTLDITKDLLGKWIKKYIGLLVLGLAYIAIINFTNVVQDLLVKQFLSEEGSNFASMGYMSPTFVGCLITTIVVFSVKFKLFTMVTSFVTNFFS